MPFVQTEVKPVEQQVGKLKLSEAIRRGCKLSRPNDGTCFYHGGTCAIGAAYEALFGNDFEESHKYGGISDRVRDYYEISEHDWLSLGINLRFLSGETREQIADWLESRGY